MRILVITIFPDLVKSVLTAGIPRKADSLGKLSVQCLNPRDFTSDSRRTVDDRPYGGGPGMVMAFNPLQQAITKAKSIEPMARVVYLSPQGKRLDQQKVRKFADQSEPLILLAGRYEGIDERLIELEVDEEISLGDYVLSGGELGAMVLIDAICRLIPGVLGHEASAIQDSFSQGLLDCPHYTRPECTKGGEKVPDVLLSGDHRLISRWRRKQSIGRTYIRRPDLMPVELNKEDSQLLEDFLATEESR